MKRWIEVKTREVWTSEDGDDGGVVRKTHTIKVEEDCENLEKECRKELKIQQPELHYHSIESFRFV